MASPSPPQNQTLSVQPPPSKSTSRRLPPPCWSHDETVALIDAYRDKWYSLRRGNLRAPHWQEVADGVFARCPLGNLPKTSIQCRHKMEKLRKRYRAEIQRIGNVPKGHRYPSSWVHFKLMDSMELGVEIDQEADEDDAGNDAVIEDDLMLYPKGIKQAIALPLDRRYASEFGNGNGNGVRIKIPNSGTLQVAPPSGLNLYNSSNGNMSFDDYPNPHYGSGNKGSRNGYMKEVENGRNIGGSGGGMKRKANDDNTTTISNSNVMDDMLAAINKLGDGFVKMERMKMDMARELESMRMKMEMKRTEMIIESHQKLLDSFSKTLLDKKKMKRMPTPES